jgi:hypothetical protein
MLSREECMATIINLEKFTEKASVKRSGISRKPGSKKLYVDFRYNGVRIVKSTGLDDNAYSGDFGHLNRRKSAACSG